MEQRLHGLVLPQVHDFLLSTFHEAWHQRLHAFLNRLRLRAFLEQQPHVLVGLLRAWSALKLHAFAEHAMLPCAFVEEHALELPCAFVAQHAFEGLPCAFVEQHAFEELPCAFVEQHAFGELPCAFAERQRELPGQLLVEVRRHVPLP
jgi:hypothetical protein